MVELGLALTPYDSSSGHGWSRFDMRSTSPVSYSCLFESWQPPGSASSCKCVKSRVSSSACARYFARVDDGSRAPVKHVPPHASFFLFSQVTTISPFNPLARLGRVLRQLLLQEMLSQSQFGSSDRVSELACTSLKPSSSSQAASSALCLQHLLPISESLPQSKETGCPQVTYRMQLLLKARWVAFLLFAGVVATFMWKRVPRALSNPTNFYQTDTRSRKQSSRLVPTLPSAYFVHGDSGEARPSYSMLFVGDDRLTATSLVFPYTQGNHQISKHSVEVGALNPRDEYMSQKSALLVSMKKAAVGTTSQDLNAQAIDSGSEDKDTASDFAKWIEGVRVDALYRGVSEEVLGRALQGIQVSSKVIEKDQHRPEVKLSADDYLKRMVDERRISNGVAMLQEHTQLLASISKEYGVPAPVLVAVWGIESSYGAFCGTWDVIEALTTLGFTSQQASRRKYFREQLIEAMLILEAGHGPGGSNQLRGSWAGAMGQCQFMPSSFRNYAVDHDGDGCKDIWESQADVLASMANYLKEHGWKDGAPILQKVRMKKKVDKSLIGIQVMKSVMDWQSNHGVCVEPGDASIPPEAMTSLVTPGGPKGKVYFVCHNFKVLLRYNSAMLYALSVCELAQQIQSRAGSISACPVDQSVA